MRQLMNIFKSAPYVVVGTGVLVSAQSIELISAIVGLCITILGAIPILIRFIKWCVNAFKDGKLDEQEKKELKEIGDTVIGAASEIADGVQDVKTKIDSNVK